MTKEQIAHDLAVAKLCGSELPPKALCEKYREYYAEILDYLKSEHPFNLDALVKE